MLNILCCFIRDCGTVRKVHLWVK